MDGASRTPGGREQRGLHQHLYLNPCPLHSAAPDISGVPFKAGGVPGSGQSVIYAAAAVPQLDTIELDTTHGAEFHDDEAQLAKYRAQLDELESRALSRDDSRTFMSELARRL